MSREAMAERQARLDHFRFSSNCRNALIFVLRNFERKTASHFCWNYSGRADARPGDRRRSAGRARQGAAESRHRGYQAQEEARIEIINLKHRMDAAGTIGRSHQAHHALAGACA